MIGEESVRLLLGVDERHHQVFAYDETVRGIRAYRFDPREGGWKSKLVATGLGVAGDAAAVDVARGIIHTVHESADDSIPRAEGLQPLPPAHEKEVLKQWPLVATQWAKGQWSSRVISAPRQLLEPR